MKLDQTNKQILEYLSQGLTRKEIAGKIFASKASIDKRLQKLFLQTGSKNNAELTSWFEKVCKSVPTSTNYPY